MKTRTVLDLLRDSIHEANAWRTRQARLRQAKEEAQHDTPPVRKQVAQEIMEQRQLKREQEKEQEKPAPTAPPPGSPLQPKNLLNLLKQTFSEWNEDKAPQLAAALA